MGSYLLRKGLRVGQRGRTLTHDVSTLGWDIDFINDIDYHTTTTEGMVDIERQRAGTITTEDEIKSLQLDEHTQTIMERPFEVEFSRSLFPKHSKGKCPEIT